MTKKQYTLLIILSSALILCYGIAGLFCNPSGDDFTYAVLGKSGDFLETVLNERQRWNGRYVSNFFVLFSPLNWGGICAYKLMSITLIISMIVSSYFTFKIILGEHQLLCSLVSTLIIFSIMPDITEGIYWYTGAWTYIPGGLIFILSLSILIKFWGCLKFHHYLMTSFLFLIAGGFNEVLSILGIIVFAIGFVKKLKEVRFIVFLALFIFIFIYIMLAPGNDIRAEYFPNKNQLISSLFKSSLYTARFIGEWLINPAFFFWGIIVTQLNFKKNLIDNLRFFQNPFLSGIVLILPTYLCCFGPIWSTGLLGQYRTPNLASYIFVISYTLIIIANKDFILKKLKLNYLSKYAFLILAASLVLWKNQFFMLKELINGDLVEFDVRMQKRYETIKNCKEKDCELTSLKNKSKTLFVYPLTDNPEHWMNKSYQLYFKSGRIVRTEK